MDLTRTEDNGGHSFVSIAAKWLASGTDDDDDDDAGGGGGGGGDDDDDDGQVTIPNELEYLSHVLQNLDFGFKFGGSASVCSLKQYCDQMSENYQDSCD